MKTDRFSWLRLIAYGALLLVCLAFYSRAEAQTAVVPYMTAQPQFLDNTGKPLASGCVFTYAAGTSTPQATYTDSTGSVANANPIILNAAGYAPSAIWFTTSAYKIQVKSFGGVACASGSTIRTEDSLQQKYFRYDGGNVFTAIADLSPALGEFWLSSTNPGFLKWSDASAIHTVVGADSTQTLTNKTLTTPTINQPLIAGVTDGSSAAAGNVGQFVQTKQTVAQSLTTTVILSLGSVSLTAGDWDIQANVLFTGTSATASILHVGISTANNAYTPNDGSYENLTSLVPPAIALAAGTNLVTNTYRVTISSTTSYFLVVDASFASGTATAQGSIRARRVR